MRPARGGRVVGGFSFRPGTSDEDIFNEVVKENEYRLPRRFKRSDVIVDVGAHIGGFSYAALRRGAGLVYAFEAEPTNYRCAVDNLKPFGARAVVNLKAVWRSDRRGDVVRLTGPTQGDGKMNTGGGNVLWQYGVEVSTVALDDILMEITANGKLRVRLLKLDCEVSEFPILLTATRLDLVDEVVGEYHELSEEEYRNVAREVHIEGYHSFKVDQLKEKLGAAGFQVSSFAHGEGSSNLGLFFARRPSVQVRGGLLRRLFGGVSRLLDT